MSSVLIYNLPETVSCSDFYFFIIFLISLAWFLVCLRTKSEVEDENSRMVLSWILYVCGCRAEMWFQTQMQYVLSWMWVAMKECKKYEKTSAAL